MTVSDVSLRERLRALPEPAWNEWLDEAVYDFDPGEEADLIALAIDPELLDAGEDDPDRWVPVHAWRALGVMRADAAVEPLLGLLEEWCEDDWAAMDLPTVFARIGGAALPALRGLAVDSLQSEFARMSAVEALERIGLLHPEHRDACVNVLSGMLREFERESPELNAMVIGSLVELAAPEAAPLMEAAFRAERVDLMYNGDWEDAQIELGLLDERVTPRPRLRPEWDLPELVDKPPLFGWRDLDPEGADALRRVFEAPDASGAVRSLRALEGFLFTIASVPEVVPPSDWIELLLDDAPIGHTEAEVNTMLRALIALYNGIQEGVNGDWFGPPEDLFREDVMANLEPDAEASQWCRGFALGHSWLEELWSVEEEEDKELGALLFTLSFFASRDVAEEYARAFSDHERPVEEITNTVRSVWPDALVEYASMGRKIGRRERAARRPQPVRASVEERTGRNDPCPCGSGRKFKKCCGRQVH